MLRVAGADARKYLQGLITSDIGKAEGRTAIHAGLLSPQGKILKRELRETLKPEAAN